MIDPLKSRGKLENGAFEDRDTVGLDWHIVGIERGREELVVAGCLSDWKQSSLIEVSAEQENLVENEVNLDLSLLKKELHYQSVCCQKLLLGHASSCFDANIGIKQVVCIFSEVFLERVLARLRRIVGAIGSLDVQVLFSDQCVERYELTLALKAHLINGRQHFIVIQVLDTAAECVLEVCLAEENVNSCIETFIVRIEVFWGNLFKLAQSLLVEHAIILFDLFNSIKESASGPRQLVYCSIVLGLCVVIVQSVKAYYWLRSNVCQIVSASR